MKPPRVRSRPASSEPSWSGSGSGAAGSGAGATGSDSTAAGSGATGSGDRLVDRLRDDQTGLHDRPGGLGRRLPLGLGRDLAVSGSRVLEVGRIGLPARLDRLGIRERSLVLLRLGRRGLGLLAVATPERHQRAGASSPRPWSASACASSSRRLMTRLTESSPTVTP